MKQYMAISTLLLLSTICYANIEKSRQFMNMSSNVPKSMMISDIISWGSDISRVRSDPNQIIKKREIDYTLTWLNKTINPNILKKFNKENFQFISGMGNKKDDALMISWSNDQFDIKVLDGRILLLSVYVKDEFQADVEEIFKKVVNYWLYADKYRVKVNIETLSATDSNDSWGKINVDQGRATGWYKNVEWYKVGNELIFAFEKVVEPPVSKIPWKAEDAPRFCGGIPIEDNRSYLRFEKSNRQELTKEYFQKRKNKVNDAHNEVRDVNNVRMK